MNTDPRCESCKAKGAWEEEVIATRELVISMLNTVVTNCFVCHKPLESSSGSTREP